MFKIVFYIVGAVTLAAWGFGVYLLFHYGPAVLEQTLRILKAA